MPESSPPRMLSAPLRLTAMTLRGLGPYLHGARLKIKPLTILCGENGSGKSTWIETLLALKLTAKNPHFPMTHLRYPQNRIERYGINQTLQAAGSGARTAGEIQNAIAELVRPDDRDKYGPLGCIGLDLEARKTHKLRGCDFREFDAETVGQNLWFRGVIPSGAKLTLRWAWPPAGNGFEQLIELRINSEFIRLRRSLDHHSDTGIRSVRPRPNKPDGRKEPHLTLECSGAFLGPEPVGGNKPIELGFVEFLNPVKKPDSDESPQLWRLDRVAPGLSLTDPEISEADVKAACASFLNLFRCLVQEALRGFFPIGSVRSLLAKTSADVVPCEQRKEEESDDDLHQEAVNDSERVRKRAAAKVRPERRYVGRNGGNTQDLHAYWAYNLMRQQSTPYCGAISSDFNDEDFIPSVSAADVFSELPDAFREHLLGPKNVPELRESWSAGCSGPDRDRLAIEVLNAALRSRNLFSRNFRPDLTSETHLEARLIIGATPEEQDARLASRDLLSDDEVMRVNRLLLEATIDKAADDRVDEAHSQKLRPDYPWIRRDCWHRTGYLFETFVSFWMKWLTGAPIKCGKFEGDYLDGSWPNDPQQILKQVPNGGLVDKKWRWQKRGIDAEQTAGREPFQGGTSYNLVGTIGLPTSGREADWSMMSTGFHQLAPIVVQAGLLRQNEIMAVENPEAHLHPSLQIKVAEFLMHQANAGKIMLIETHSDLIVRRIHRAIVQDQFAQGTFSEEMVGIHFTRLKDEKDEQCREFLYAVCDKIEINEQGEIANWPKGFLDADIKESRRMFDAMYGAESEDDEDGQ